MGAVGQEVFKQSSDGCNEITHPQLINVRPILPHWSERQTFSYGVGSPGQKPAFNN